MDPGSGPGAVAGKPWHAHDWLVRFGIAWAKRKGVLSYGAGDSDAIATRALGEVLEALAPQERAQAQQEADVLFGRYFALPRAGDHPFKWFVERFNGLRLPGRREPATRAAPSRSDGNIDALTEWLGKEPVTE